jgi:hypothetical protein
MQANARISFGYVDVKIDSFWKYQSLSRLESCDVFIDRLESANAQDRTIHRPDHTVRCGRKAEGGTFKQTHLKK